MTKHMETNGKLYAKVTIAAVAVPLLVWAYASGPDAGYSGVPSDNGGGTCATAGCHGGTVNSSSGSVKVTFPGGTTYVPGVKQHLIVTVADPAVTQRRWGFQMTARLASNSSTMAGSFTSTDAFTFSLCAAAGSLQNYVELGSSATCAAARPLQFIEHTLSGSSRVQTGSQNYEFDWTPPATDSGNVVIYVAGNAANGNGNADTGDHIYSARYTLTPAAPAGPVPTVSAVENGASFAPGIVPNSFVQIKGTNLASSTNLWDSAIVAGALPTKLDGVSVSMGGKAAYVYYVSPTQVNVLAPQDVGTGTMQVTVTNSGTASAGFTSTANSFGPAFFLWANKYAVATHYPDFTWAVKNGTFSGVTTVPAKPGEVIILWGTGFGVTNPAPPAGTVVPADKAYSTSSPVTVTVGGTTATVYGAALASGFAGLYQVAIEVPASAPDGDLPVVATINGAQSPATTVITVQR
jgi:uncharacterized protein (TIGR03437 family)